MRLVSALLLNVKIVAGFFFKQNLDMTHSIAANFRDGLHLVQNDIAVQKYMIEYTLANLNTEFKQEVANVGGVELLATYDDSSPVDIRHEDKFGWYLFPFKNGTTPFYTTNEQ